ncbi:MAG TPA: PAS domain S-box protein [Gallionella sp.]|nr:PAS domain S-box protein [Gallionella sp.]
MRNDTRLSTRLAVGLIVVLAAGVLAMWHIEHSRLREAYVSERAANLDKSIQSQRLRLNQQIDVLRRDVQFLSNTPPVSGIVRAALNGGVDPLTGNDLPRWERRLQEIFSVFVQAHPDYYRIRFIGVAGGGREIVGVERRDGKAVSVATDTALRYGARDFFAHGLRLQEGEVHLSEFEYQQKQAGSGRIRTLRAVTAVREPDGKVFGMLVISLDVGRLLDSAREGLPADVQAYVTNMAGQYLLHPDAKRSFVFGPADRDGITADFPVLLQMFQSNAGGVQPAQAMTLSEDKQLFAATRLHFDPANPQRFLVLMYRIPDVLAGVPIFSLRATHVAVGLAGLLLIGVVAMWMLRRTFAPLEQLAQAADRIAAGEHDIVLPREGGIEIGRLAQAIGVMLAELSRREREILQANAELEQRVAQRTGDLSFSNELLQAAIDESKKRQQEVAVQLRRNLALMATSMDGIHVMDMQGNIVEANDAFCRMLGYSREEIAGLNVADWEAQWSAEDMRARFASLIGKAERFETVHRRKDGSLIDVEISTAGVELDGQSYLFASSRDITERKKAEALMRQHEKVIETAIDGFWMTDLKGFLLEVNRAYADISGYSNEELVGMHISQLEANERPEDVRAHMEMIVARGHDRFETRHRRKDGSLVDIEVSVTFLAEPECMFVFCRDISQRKRDEQDRQIAAVAFETRDAILITDADANIIRVNRSFEQITGYSAADVLGKNPRIMSSGRHDKEFYAEMWRSLKEDGAWTGEIWDKRKNGQVYPRWMTITAVRNEKNEITHYVGVFTDITERKRAEEEIRNLAFYDALTGLPNRRLLLERFRTALASSARRRHYGALLFLDMDRFKVLNDTLGHDYGDLMLIQVASRIRSCVREMDTVSRLGGDEFVVLVEDAGNDEQEAQGKLATVAEKIREKLARPYRLRGREHQSSPSIGVTLYRGNGESPEVLLRRADLAMYQAKKCGRNAVRFFSPEMEASSESDEALADDLSRAIGRGELQLHYQVQVDGELRPVGAEALLRWMHGRRGLLMPDQFLTLAERGKAIVDIDRWVLDEACGRLARWSAGEHTRALMLAVNVSARSFAQPGFTGHIAAMLKKHRVRPELLILEMTENMVLDDLPGAVRKMRELKSLGVSLSMDDFGSGYSSLTYLKQLPLDQVKICRAFVQGAATNVNDALLVQAIADLAVRFGLSVLAEGIETEAQLAFARRQNCMVYQGFLFGKPVAAEEFETGLAALP